MPASLVSAHIRGIRSYSPRTEREQVIEFMPLTLIVGSNGTGKTTIIESLKYIISGAEPPNSDSRRNFIHDSQNDKISGVDNSEYACIELRFKNKSGVPCSARRIISKGVKTTPQAVSCYKIGSRDWIPVHRQDDWAKVIPQLFGLPNQAVLNSVILCHQEDNLWCMADSASVKLVFDKIFGCEEYKKEIKHIDDELRNSKRDRDVTEKEIEGIRDRIIRKDELSKKIANLESDLKRIQTDSLSITKDLELLESKRDSLSRIVKVHEVKTREIDRLKQRIQELTERIATYKGNLEVLSVKRPVQTAPEVVVQQPAKKKPALDPTAADLELIAQDICKILSSIEAMSPTEDLAKLTKLVEDVLSKINALKDKFTVPQNEPVVSQVPVRDEVSEQEDRINRIRSNYEKKIKESADDLEALHKTIESLQEQTVDQTEYDEAQRELKSLEKELERVRHDYSKMTGSKSYMERELTEYRRELDRYRRVNTQYSKTMAKLVCCKLIISDLEKLKVCIQDSIIAFHDQMILKINDLLLRRWRIIYQGTDIESIELVDEEIVRGKDKKSYNYYIAMRKGGKRMKMREKSSAGQRALAAIIIRMTLAELFVQDFAFIALDEPTANLDLANVQALAKSIGVYVKRRTKLGVNVQWIIITHDEQFLRALDEECSPFFYRIKMNPNDKCSEIVKLPCPDSAFMQNGDLKDTN